MDVTSYELAAIRRGPDEDDLAQTFSTCIDACLDQDNGARHHPEAVQLTDLARQLDGYHLNKQGFGIDSMEPAGDFNGQGYKTAGYFEALQCSYTTVRGKLTFSFPNGGGTMSKVLCDSDIVHCEVIQGKAFLTEEFVLIVATVDEVRLFLLSVTLEGNSDPVNPPQSRAKTPFARVAEGERLVVNETPASKGLWSVRVDPTQYRVSTENRRIVRIAGCSRTGRVYLGSYCGGVYEFRYSKEEEDSGWFGTAAKRVKTDLAQVAKSAKEGILCTFAQILHGPEYSENVAISDACEVLQLVIDNTRNLLWALRRDCLQVFDARENTPLQLVKMDLENRIYKPIAAQWGARRVGNRQCYQSTWHNRTSTYNTNVLLIDNKGKYIPIRAKTTGSTQATNEPQRNRQYADDSVASSNWRPIDFLNEVVKIFVNPREDGGELAEGGVNSITPNPNSGIGGAPGLPGNVGPVSSHNSGDTRRSDKGTPAASVVNITGGVASCVPPSIGGGAERQSSRFGSNSAGMNSRGVKNEFDLCLILVMKDGTRAFLRMPKVMASPASGVKSLELYHFLQPPAEVLKSPVHEAMYLPYMLTDAFYRNGVMLMSLRPAIAFNEFQTCSNRVAADRRARIKNAEGYGARACVPRRVARSGEHNTTGVS